MTSLTSNVFEDLQNVIRQLALVSDKTTKRKNAYETIEVKSHGFEIQNINNVT